MCELCERLKKAHDGGNQAEIDRAEREWWKAKLSEIGLQDGASVIVELPPDIANTMATNLKAQIHAVDDMATGSLIVALRRIAGEKNAFPDEMFEDVSATVSMLTHVMQRMFIYGYWTAKRGEILNSFRVAEEGHDG